MAIKSHAASDLGVPYQASWYSFEESDSAALQRTENALCRGNLAETLLGSEGRGRPSQRTRMHGTSSVRALYTPIIDMYEAPDRG